MKRYDDINVIIYSTSGFPIDVIQIEALRATFVRKANSFRDLRELIFKLLDHKK